MADRWIHAVNRAHSFAITEDGEPIEITNWIDIWGHDCSPDDAVVAIAGPDAGKKWHVIDLRQFDNVGMH